MTSISDTIQTAIPTATRQYPSCVRQAVAALEDREDAIKDGLRKYATDRGVSDSEIDDLFEDVGLNEPVVDPEPLDDTAEGATPLERMVRSLAETVRDLSEKVESLTRR